MEEIRNGSRTAFRALFEYYWQPLVTYAASIAGPESAEDCVQEAFVGLWRHRERWKPTGSVAGYIYRITRNAALNARRVGRSEDALRSGSLHQFRPIAAPPTPHEDFVARRLRSEVTAAVEALPERRREVLLMARVHGLSHAEIADAMGISPQTVANQMSAALRELRVRLEGFLTDS